MIEKTSAFKTSDGHTHPTLEAAQAHALGQLGIEHENVLKNKDAVISILKLKPRKKAVKAKAAKKTEAKAA